MDDGIALWKLESGEFKGKTIRLLSESELKHEVQNFPLDHIVCIDGDKKILMFCNFDTRCGYTAYGYIFNTGKPAA